MKKLFVIIAVITMVLATTGIAFADDSNQMGPPDGYHDGDPEGCLQYGPNGSVSGVGPAPNAGSGDHEGPGW